MQTWGTLCPALPAPKDLRHFGGWVCRLQALLHGIGTVLHSRLSSKKAVLMRVACCCGGRANTWREAVNKSSSQDLPTGLPWRFLAKKLPFAARSDKRIAKNISHMIQDHSQSKRGCQAITQSYNSLRGLAKVEAHWGFWNWI